MIFTHVLWHIHVCTYTQVCSLTPITHIHASKMVHCIKRQNLLKCPYIMSMCSGPTFSLKKDCNSNTHYTWMSLEDTLNIISQAQRNEYCLLPFVWANHSSQSQEGGKEIRDGQRQRGRGNRVSVYCVCCSMLEGKSTQVMKRRDVCSGYESTSYHWAVHLMYKTMSLHISYVNTV